MIRRKWCVISNGFTRTVHMFSTRAKAEDCAKLHKLDTIYWLNKDTDRYEQVKLVLDSAHHLVV
jgi:hypothetical protein